MPFQVKYWIYRKHLHNISIQNSGKAFTASLWHGEWLGFTTTLTDQSSLSVLYKSPQGLFESLYVQPTEYYVPAKLSPTAIYYILQMDDDESRIRWNISMVTNTQSMLLVLRD